LRKVKPQQIVDASPKTLNEADAQKNVGLAFVPSVEVDLPRNNESVSDFDLPFLTESPEKLMKEGRFQRIPLLLGFNSHEAMLFIRREKSQRRSLLNILMLI
jgi:carboxylesterase type B